MFSKTVKKKSDSFTDVEFTAFTECDALNDVNGGVCKVIENFILKHYVLISLKYFHFVERKSIFLPLRLKE